MEEIKKVEEKKSFDKKTFSLGFLSGVIIGVVAIAVISLWYESSSDSALSGPVEDFYVLEREYLNLDERFSNEIKNIYPSDTSSDAIVNNSFAALKQTKSILEKIIPKINDIADYSEKYSKEGKEKGWFDLVNKCYLTRKDIYEKYSNIVENQTILVKAAQTENILTDSLDELSNIGGEIKLYTATQDKVRLLSTLNNAIANFVKIKTSFSELKSVMPTISSIDAWIKYSNGSIALFNSIKKNLESTGFTEEVTSEDRELANKGLMLGKQREVASEKYAREVKDWVFNNRDLIQQDIERLVIEANQKCQSAGFVDAESSTN